MTIRISFFCILASFLILGGSLTAEDRRNLDLASFQSAQMLHDILAKGFFEFGNTSQGQGWYQSLYQEFAQLIHRLDGDPAFKDHLLQIDADYVLDQHNTRFGHAPIGYVSETKSGKTKKNYLHYTKPYWDFLAHHHADRLKALPELGHFMERLEELRCTSEQVFSKTIEELEGSFPGLRDLMMAKESELSIVIKVVQYLPCAEPASHFHVDFSGLSILLHNSDMMDTLCICPYQEPLRAGCFLPPIRCISNSHAATSALLVPGLALREHGLSLPPTPHGVPPQHDIRYAVIAFAMVPGSTLSYKQIRVHLDPEGAQASRFIGTESNKEETDRDRQVDQGST